MRKRVTAAPLLLTVLLLTASCVRHTTANVPVSPFDNALGYNAQLATINNAVSQGVQQAANVGLLPVDSSVQVVQVCSHIAQIDDQITLILQDGPDLAKLNADKIKLMVDDVKTSIKTLVGNKALGIKNPKTQQLVANEVDMIANLADIVLSSLRQAGVM